MCDTLVAVTEATADGSVILAKNSDRHPNEAQVLAHFPRAQHEPGSMVKCTYDEFHFARCYSDFLFTTFDGCKTRQKRSTELLKAQEGQITAETMMAALRDHEAEAAGSTDWNPSKGMFMETLCVHASFGPTRLSQSVGAMVAHLAPDLQTYWLTGTSGTCTGIFKPVYLGGAGLPDLGPEPNGTYDSTSLWWNHERLHRAVIRDYATRLPLYQEDRDALEATFRREAAEAYKVHRGVNAEERAGPLAALTASCFERASQATAEWTDAVLQAPIRHRPSRLFSLAWNQVNKQAGFALR